MIKKLLNPIGNFDEKLLLGLGLVFVLVNVGLGEMLGFKMGSVMKFLPSSVSMEAKALAVLKAFALAIVAFYLLGLLINKRVRFIDIANTFLIGVIPNLLITPVSYTSHFKGVLNKVLENPYQINPVDISQIMLLAIISLPFVIYSIIIIYNGFKTATNMKKVYHIVIFILALFIIPVLSQLI